VSGILPDETNCVPRRRKLTSNAGPDNQGDREGFHLAIDQASGQSIAAKLIRFPFRQTLAQRSRNFSRDWAISVKYDFSFPATRDTEKAAPRRGRYRHVNCKAIPTTGATRFLEAAQGRQVSWASPDSTLVVQFQVAAQPVIGKPSQRDV